LRPRGRLGEARRGGAARPRARRSIQRGALVIADAAVHASASAHDVVAQHHTSAPRDSRSHEGRPQRLASSRGRAPCPWRARWPPLTTTPRVACDGAEARRSGGPRTRDVVVTDHPEEVPMAPHDDDASLASSHSAPTSDTPFAHASLLSVRAHFDALVALSEASVALRRARDCLLIVDGETLAGAVCHVLSDATHGLATELGQVLAAEGEQARDLEVR